MRLHLVYHLAEFRRETRWFYHIFYGFSVPYRQAEKLVKTRVKPRRRLFRAQRGLDFRYCTWFSIANPYLLYDASWCPYFDRKYNLLSHFVVPCRSYSPAFEEPDDKSWKSGSHGCCIQRGYFGVPDSWSESLCLIRFLYEASTPRRSSLRCVSAHPSRVAGRLLPATFFPPFEVASPAADSASPVSLAPLLPLPLLPHPILLCLRLAPNDLFK